MNIQHLELQQWAQNDKGWVSNKTAGGLCGKYGSVSCDWWERALRE